MTISDDSDETKWTWEQIPNQTLVTKQLEQEEIIILLFSDFLIFFFFWKNQRILLVFLYRHLDEGLVPGGEMATGGLNHQNVISAWRQLLKAGKVKHTAQHAGSSRDPHFLWVVEPLPGGSGLSLLLAGNSVCLRVCVGSPHCPHVLEDECFWRITSVQFGWFPESKIFTFKIYFYTHRKIDR